MNTCKGDNVPASAACVSVPGCVSRARLPGRAVSGCITRASLPASAACEIKSNVYPNSYMSFPPKKNLSSMSAAVFALVMLLCLGVQAARASQVFDVHVEVNTTQITTTDHEYINDLGPLIREYLQTNSFTEDRFLEHERIRLNIQVIINSVQGRRFQASLVISSERPIYNTMQLTPVLVVSDNSWSFEFARGASLLFDTYQYDEIATVLDFYAYFFLGLDYDTFSELGGESFFREAQRIADMGQSSGAGWSSSSSRRSRTDLISQMINPEFEDLRKAQYMYHRHGLDLFTSDAERSRDNILEAFDLIHQVQRRTSARYLFDLIFSAKHREYRAIFMEADTDRRLQAYNVLVTIDDSRISEYDRLQ